jgi:uncharacterized Zn finger protein
MNPIKESYPNGECPDCGEEIPDDVVAGDECKNCGHVFWEENI